LSAGLCVSCPTPSKDVAAGPGLEKLKSMLGSTPDDADKNEVGLEFACPVAIVSKDCAGPGEDKPCRL
jgi:hypothetical protein